MPRLLRFFLGLTLSVFWAKAWAAPYMVAAHNLHFPEGVIWVEDSVYFVDYVTSDVLRLQGDTVSRVWHQDGCDPTGLARVDRGLMVACYDSNAFATISMDGLVIETLTHDASGNSFHVPNDLALDHKGGVYLTCSGSGPFSGGVYYRLGDGGIISVATGLDNANGLAVSADGNVLFVGESGTDLIWAYPIEENGRLGGRKRFIDLRAALADKLHPHPAPDGVRIDKAGNLFIALYNGGGIAIFNSGGKLLKNISLPRTHHTSLTISSDEKLIYATAVDDLPAGGYQGDLLLLPNPIYEAASH